MLVVVVILVLIVYIKVVVVKKFVVEFWVWLVGLIFLCIGFLMGFFFLVNFEFLWFLVNWDFYFEKIRVFKVGNCLNILVWNNRIGCLVLFCWFLGLL